MLSRLLARLGIDYDVIDVDEPRRRAADVMIAEAERARRRADMLDEQAATVMVAVAVSVERSEHHASDRPHATLLPIADVKARATLRRGQVVVTPEPADHGEARAEARHLVRKRRPLR